MVGGEAHEQVTDSRMGELLDLLESSTLDADQSANVREMRRTYDQAVRLPNPSLKPSLKHVQKRCWHGSLLEQIRILRRSNLRSATSLNSREKNQSLGITSTPYDVLLDEYEVGMTVEDYDPLFAGLRERLVPLLEAITKAQEVVKEPEMPVVGVPSRRPKGVL